MADDDNKPNPAEAFQKLLEKNNNDATRLASQLFDENYQLREKNRQLTTSQPKEGSVVLTADEAKRWKQFQELDQDPKEIKKSLEKLPQLEADNKELARAESIREASAASNFKPSVLKSLLKDYPEAALSLKDETDSKTKQSRKVAYITLEGKESSLEQFANENFADFLPALKVEASTTPAKPGNGNDPPASGGPGSIFDRIREAAKSKQAPSPATELNTRFGMPT